MSTLPGEHNVYRLVFEADRPKRNGGKPNPSAFLPSKHDDLKMSVDYDQLTTPEETLARCGATHHPTKAPEFKDHTKRTIFSLNIGFLDQLSCVQDVYPSPVNLQPCPVGRPNNPSHSSAEFNKVPTPEDEPEILSQIQDHVNGREIFPDSDRVEVLVTEYRSQWA